MNDMVDVTVNGEPRAVARGATLLELLESLALDPRAVVVEHNRTIVRRPRLAAITVAPGDAIELRSEEHTSELQSQSNLVCRLLLEKKKNTLNRTHDLAENQATTFTYTSSDQTCTSCTPPITTTDRMGIRPPQPLIACRSSCSPHEY